MNGTKMTEYTFNFEGAIKVTVNGTDTEDNYQKATEQAIKLALKDIDENWIYDVNAEEFYDCDMKEAV